MKPRQCGLLICGLALFLTACGSDRARQVVGTGGGYIGNIAADEPNAVLVGRDILASDGAAADAAVAIGLTLAVTYPNAAALGGGGQCIAYQQDGPAPVALTFPALSARAEGPVAVPGMVRGLAALHARFGRLRWSRLVTPAEAIARFGKPMSRALNRVIRELPSTLLSRPGIGAVAYGPDGRQLDEGDPLLQADLAATLGTIRRRGASAFYTGQFAQDFVSAVNGLGANLTLADLRDYRAEWQDGLRFRVDFKDVTTIPDLGGKRLAAFWEASGDDTAAQLSALAEVYQDLPSAAPVGSSSTTGFVVTDRFGGTVACNLTMRKPFGLGAMAEGTGILLSPPPDPSLDGAPYMSPFIARAAVTDDILLVGTASGGAAALPAAVTVGRQIVEGTQSLPDAIGAPRLMRAGPDAVILHEPGALAVEDQTAGAPRVEVGALGRVNAIHCPGGFEPELGACMSATDPRGFGLTVVGN